MAKIGTPAVGKVWVAYPHSDNPSRFIILGIRPWIDSMTEFRLIHVRHRTVYPQHRVNLNEPYFDVEFVEPTEFEERLFAVAMLDIEAAKRVRDHG
jgi:hypothetical protein